MLFVHRFSLKECAYLENMFISEQNWGSEGEERGEEMLFFQNYEVTLIFFNIILFIYF